ncbi:MAG: hypothetical protein A2017_11615 [Lentisphaerae bacterium GWF2_44_16]|nr:MAG: hypothetical protein A2017_11615 [Lentisphaerae bacterium GWF2_44_16]
MTDVYSRFTKYWLETGLCIKGVLKAWVYSAGDRDDIFQNIALTAWKNFSDFDQEKGSFKSWTLGIARIEYLKYLRTIKSGNNVFDSELADISSRAEEKENDSIQNMYWSIDKCMEKLTEDKKSLLKMKYYQKMSTSEITEALKLSEATVKERLYRMRKELRSCIERQLEQQ